MNNIFVEETFKEQYPDYKEILKLLPLGLISVSRTPLVDEIKLEYPSRNIFITRVIWEDKLALSYVVNKMLGSREDEIHNPFQG